MSTGAGPRGQCGTASPPGTMGIFSLEAFNLEEAVLSSESIWLPLEAFPVVHPGGLHSTQGSGSLDSLPGRGQCPIAGQCPTRAKDRHCDPGCPCAPGRGFNSEYKRLSGKCEVDSSIPGMVRAGSCPRLCVEKQGGAAPATCTTRVGPQRAWGDPHSQGPEG